jgi:integrase/recombinase XerD
MRTLEELIKEVDLELVRIGYPQQYTHRHDRICNLLLLYSKEQGETYFTEKLGEKFLSEQYGYPQNFPEAKLEGYTGRVVRAVSILGDFQQYGVIRRSSHRTKEMCPNEYTILLQGYREYEFEHGRATSTVQNKSEYVALFLCFMAARGVMEIDMFKPCHIKDYFKTLPGCHIETIRSTGCAIRSFFTFLNKSERLPEDLSVHVPVIRRIYEHKLPSTWNRDEVEKLLAAVDRGNPCGKRDYAILLMITRLGLRRGDVENLRLSDINWEKSEVSLVQRKTAQPLKLPLLTDVGEAIIDYLRYGRPQSLCNHVFVKDCAPYTDYISAGNIMNKYVTAAKLDVSNRKHGLHTLRHTLARRLLEERVPLQTIAAVLGHASIYSTEDYLHIDVDDLRCCALELEEATHDA